MLFVMRRCSFCCNQDMIFSLKNEGSHEGAEPMKP